MRNYHKAFYRPQNLCLIVAGKVDTEELFHAIAAVERKIVAKRDHVPIGCSPWSSPPPEFAETSVKVVEFPADDESTGTVLVSWRGPHILELQAMAASSVLFAYLTEESVSPLQHALVDIPEPYVISSYWLLS